MPKQHQDNQAERWLISYLPHFTIRQMLIPAYVKDRLFYLSWFYCSYWCVSLRSVNVFLNKYTDGYGFGPKTDRQQVIYTQTDRQPLNIYDFKLPVTENPSVFEVISRLFPW